MSDSQTRATSGEFIALARSSGGRIAARLGMRELRTASEKLHASVTWGNASRAYALGIEWAPDYRVYAKLSRNDIAPEHTPPLDPGDFTAFDLETVLANKGLPYEALGEYGRGTRSEVEAALDTVTKNLEQNALEFLGPDPDPWHRLGMVYAERVRRWRNANLGGRLDADHVE